MSVSLSSLSDYIIENNNAVQTFWADCSVYYEGRATGSTETAHRLILIKPDGNIQVIADELHKPVNWQPTGATLDTTCNSNELVIHSNHPRTDDTLEITIYDAHSYNAVVADTGQRCVLEDTEDDYHEHLMNNPSEIGLSSDAALSHEVKTDVGRIDLYEEEENIIIEVKRRKATLDAVSQLSRYKEKCNPSEAILACPSITSNAEKLAEEKGIRIEKIKL